MELYPASDGRHAALTVTNASHASLLSGFSGTQESLPVDMPDPIRISDPDQLGSVGQKRAG